MARRTAGLSVRITIAHCPASGLISCGALFRPIRGGCGAPESANTISHVSISCAPISFRVRKRNREDIKPPISAVFKSLHETGGLAGRRLRRCGAS